jgi:hypothetical protein
MSCYRKATLATAAHLEDHFNSERAAETGDGHSRVFEAAASGAMATNGTLRRTGRNHRPTRL